MTIVNHAALPNALSEWPRLLERLSGRQLVVFLDYDGTLVPIAPRPELATLSADYRRRLECLAEAWPTTILSGRARPQVANLVAIPALNYVGAHGFDLALANAESVLVHAPIRAVIAAAAAELEQHTGDTPGVLIENKEFVVAIHFRNVDPERVPELLRQYDQVAARFPALRKTAGKQLRELLPNIDWHKGKALLWVMEQLQLESAIPIFVGDDLTDEDAFEAVADRGIGILVTSEIRPRTAARYVLRDVSDVYELLQRLGDLR